MPLAFLPPTFPHKTGKNLCGFCVRCAGSHEGVLWPKGMLSDKDPEHLCQGLSEASRKESENDAANQRKTNPPSPTPNQPELCPGPLFHSCCWRCWRAGRNNSFSESQDQGPHIPISKSKELKWTGWDFIGIECAVVPNGSDAQDYLENSLWEKDLVILMDSSSVWARKTYAIILRPP